MKLKNGFVLREIAGETIVVSVNSTLNLHGIIKLNSTAQTLWRALESGVESIDDLAKALMGEYDVDEIIAHRSAEDFIAKLKELDFLEV